MANRFTRVQFDKGEANAALDFIIENHRLGMSPVRMIHDELGEVDVLAYVVVEEGDEEDDYLIQPIMMLITPDQEHRYSFVPEPPPPPPEKPKLAAPTMDGYLVPPKVQREVTTIDGDAPLTGKPAEAFLDE